MAQFFYLSSQNRGNRFGDKKQLDAYTFSSQKLKVFERVNTCTKNKKNSNKSNILPSAASLGGIEEKKKTVVVAGTSD